MQKIIVLGGTNTERLYLKRDRFKLNDELIEVFPTNLPDINMKDLIARHKSRYYLAGLFLRPDTSWADIPCGSGYACELFKDYRCYFGWDKDQYTVEYARRNYGGKHRFFGKQYLEEFNFAVNFDLITCIEGIEHLTEEYQRYTIENLYKQLRLGGTLIITTPQPNHSNNSFHLHELDDIGFSNLLGSKFKDVQILKQKDINHLEQETVFLYGICRK